VVITEIYGGENSKADIIPPRVDEATTGEVPTAGAF
jgi:hypothetical protein